MARLKTPATRNRLLRRVRRQRLSYITVLPSLITILNGACGFAAISFAGKAASVNPGQFSYANFHVPFFAMSGYMILLAMIADMLDGRVARMSHSTSSFGGQLDSLCDVISFGVAPAYLMLCVLEHQLSSVTGLNPAAEGFLSRFIWLAAAAYMCCAAIRLARFNVENEEDESAHMSFLGLPTPAAAGVVVSLVIFHQETLKQLSETPTGIYSVLDSVIVYALPFVVLWAALLMVSRVRYPHVVNQYIKGKKPFAHLIWLLIGIWLIVWSIQIAMVLIFCGYATVSFSKWIYLRTFKPTASYNSDSEIESL